MARRHRDRKLDPSPHRGRSIDTEKQMRDAFLHRSRSLARRFADVPLHPLRTIRNLMMEDLRREKRFQAQNLPTQTYRCVDGSTALIDGVQVDSNKMRQQGVSPRLRFEFRDPHRTLVCTRRKARRAAIFAMRKAGKAGKRNRKARWTDKSYISCRKGR